MKAAIGVHGHSADLFRITGQQNRWQVWLYAPSMFDESDAICAWHGEVCHQHVDCGRVCKQNHKGLGRINGLNRRIIVNIEKVGQRFAHRIVIVDDEDALGTLHRLVFG